MQQNDVVWFDSRSILVARPEHNLIESNQPYYVGNELLTGERTNTSAKYRSILWYMPSSVAFSPEISLSSPENILFIPSKKYIYIYILGSKYPKIIYILLKKAPLMLSAGNLIFVVQWSGRKELCNLSAGQVIPRHTLALLRMPAVKLLKPKYRTGQRENYFFLLSRKNICRMKVSKNFFNLISKKLH